MTECPLCGAVDPPLWWKELEDSGDMNPEILPYTKQYILPVRIYHASVLDAMAAWGMTMESGEGEHNASEAD